jgi:GNAT superfamily N-acetyltransferase
MLHIIRTDSDNPDFRELVRLLDQDLAIRDGEEHAFYSQFNQLDKIRYAVVAYFEDLPVGCGALRAYSDDAVEVKRMFVLPELRGRGIAGRVLSELETWAGELGFARCMLETGKKQPEAIHLYQKSGYELIPNYGQYLEVENSVCMEKRIK